MCYLCVGLWVGARVSRVAEPGDSIELARAWSSVAVQHPSLQASASSKQPQAVPPSVWPWLPIGPQHPSPRHAWRPSLMATTAMISPAMGPPSTGGTS